ncbi:MAG: methyltransferase domain-containing protein [Gemmataceae bacterium]|nr:methyltransferase domain-containing protein [Gemmataceae bacterium]
MPTKKSTRKKPLSFARLVPTIESRLRPPFGIALGSPGDAAELAHCLPEGETTCWQLDQFQADRLSEALRLRGRDAKIAVTPDLWDLDGAFQTLLYPVAFGGERALKLDVIEQAFHALKPQGSLVLFTPYDHDHFFAPALKKIFGKVHLPMEGDNAIFWCQRNGDRPRRRHEMTYHVRVDEATSYAFTSRPGVFGYGFFDEGGRALTEVMELSPGQRVLDLGCGVGTNGIIAARQIGSNGSVAFADSNVRAIALAELNAKAMGVAKAEFSATCTLDAWPDRSFDVVLANPPYYAQGTITHHFVERSYALLKPGGRFYLVTKQVDLAIEMMREFFPEPEMFENRGYIIFVAER